MSDTPVIYENPKEPWSGAVGHKFVRLTEPVYYVPINPYTDDEGFLKGEGRQPQWVNDNHLVVVEWLDGARSNARPPYMHDWGKVAKYKIIGEEQEEHPTEETDHRRETAERIVQFICESEPHQETVDAQKILAEHKLERLICVPHDVLVQLIENALENEDLEEGLRLLRKHNRNLYKKSGVGENGDDPEQFVSGDPVPFVDKPCSPSDATYPREAVQRAYEHGLRDGRASQDEKYTASLDPSCKPRSPSDAITADDLQFIFQDGRTGVGVGQRTEAGGFRVLKWLPPMPMAHGTKDASEQRHRNELAARLGVPVPGMAEWMEGPLREARRHDFRVAAMLADAMIEKEKEDA